MNCEHLNNIPGLQFMPIKADKKPIFKEWQHTAKKYDLSNVEAVGLVCGKLSGNLQAIDFDLKYDLTGTLMPRYKELVNGYSPDLLKKLFWQQTRSGGFHALFRCETIGSNQKLAQREATEEEQKAGDKIMVLIETREEGGQVAIAPTDGYKLIQGTFETIPTITPSERETLLLCARNFQEVFKERSNYEIKKMTFEGKSPLDDYDERGDCVSLLAKHGWVIVLEKGPKILLKRPGSSETAHSGNFDRDKNWFSVFSTSTVFEAQSPYKPSAVFAMLECGGDYHEAAKRLLEQGYGEKKRQEKIKVEVKSRIPIGDTSLSYIVSDEEMEADMKMWRSGNFPKGLPWGMELDNFHLLKRGQFNIMNGHDNVGKTTLMWWLATVSACLHGWKWLIFSSENKHSTVKKRVIEFYWGADITQINEAQYKTAAKFFTDHFWVLRNTESYTYVDLLNAAVNTLKIWKFDGMLIDPYNSLVRETNGGKISTHDYDYEAASVMQTFMAANDVTVYLNCHAISYAARQKDTDGNPAAPMKADTEGGSKWGAKAHDFLTAHRLVYDDLDWRKMQVHVRKVKETETGGKCTPLNEPVILEMFGHFGFTDKYGIDPIAKWRNRPTQTEIIIPPTAVKPNATWTDSAAIKEATEELDPYKSDPLNAY